MERQLETYTLSLKSVFPEGKELTKKPKKKKKNPKNLLQFLTPSFYEKIKLFPDWIRKVLLRIPFEISTQMPPVFGPFVKVAQASSENWDLRARFLPLCNALGLGVC